MDRITVEIRAASLDGNKLSGFAHVYGTTARIAGNRLERFRAGAFDKVLRDPNTDVRAFWQHDPRWLLGRQSSGTVRLEAADEGLAFQIDLPNTSYANDLKELVDRGDLNEMSFGFIPGEVATSKAPEGMQLREHIAVRQLIDISPVAMPAFTGTSISLRSDEERESPRSAAARARARVRHN